MSMCRKEHVRGIIARLLVAWAVDALSQRPLQVLGPYRLEHVVPQGYGGPVVGFAREMEAIGSEVGTIGAAIGEKRNV